MAVTKPQLTVFGPRNNDTVNLNQPFPVTGQVTNQFVSGEPVTIDSVTVRVDSGPVIDANLTVVPDKTQTRVNFAASAQVTGGADPHAVTVTATNDQGISTAQMISVLTAPVVVPPPTIFTVQHAYIDRTENVTVHEQNDTTVVTYSFSREILIRHPGQLQGFAFAEYFIHEQADGTGPPPLPKRVDLPLSIKLYSPDGLEFPARIVTFDDLNRFRDLRGVSQGSWRLAVNGDSGPIPISRKDGLFVSAGQATVKAGLNEPVPSQSAGPLVEAAITRVGAQVFSFDLFRVGQFTANVQSKSGVTPWQGTLQLKAPGEPWSH